MDHKKIKTILWAVIGLLAFLMILSLVLGWGRQNPETAPTSQPVTAAPTAALIPAATAGGAAVTPAVYPAEITPSEAAEKQAAGALIVDVRETSEWDAGHVQGAVLIPLGDLSTRLAEVPKDREVVVMCRSGRRSAQARDYLLQMGYTTVTSLAGGINEWKAQGLPLVTGP